MAKKTTKKRTAKPADPAVAVIKAALALAAETPWNDISLSDIATAAKIAEKSMISTMVVKEAVNRSFEVPLREGLLFERRIFHSLFATEDQKEGMSAFLEKREAQFRDK